MGESRTPEHSIIAVTPAGRSHYLEILKNYILKDDSIAEWHLWDNCRRPSDRRYIEGMGRQHAKVKIVRAPSIDGSNRAINQFYRGLNDKNAFYIKLDDDVVYLPHHFGRSLYAAAIRDAGRFTYWSPLVINNAICSWLIKHHSQMHVSANLMAAASCPTGWKNPYFAETLHRAFIAAYDNGSMELFTVPDFSISLSRFSINCIGFFGSDVVALGDTFCPLDTDDEEWISAVLPSKIGKPGRIVGNLRVAHFAFFTQEFELLRSGILEEYYRIAGVTPIPHPKDAPGTLRKVLRRKLEVHVLKRYGGVEQISPRQHGSLSPS